MPILSGYWNKFQACLFPHLETVLEEPLTRKLKQFIRTLDVVGMDKHIATPFAQGDGTQTSRSAVDSPRLPRQGRLRSAHHRDASGDAATATHTPKALRL